jgi:hypothetical protein
VQLVLALARGRLLLKLDGALVSNRFRGVPLGSGGVGRIGLVEPC